MSKLYLTLLRGEKSWSWQAEFSHRSNTLFVWQ